MQIAWTVLKAEMKRAQHIVLTTIEGRLDLCRETLGFCYEFPRRLRSVEGEVARFVTERTTLEAEVRDDKMKLELISS